MTTKPRLSTNVIACLEDAQALIGGRAWPALWAASDLAERHEDARLLAALNRLSQALASIEHHVRNARQGRYEVEVRRR
jgi:hypothetical protein